MLGAARDDSSGDEDDGNTFLDAAQLKVAQALQRRLQAELVMEDASTAALPAADQQQRPMHQQAGDAADDAMTGVRLFSRVKAGAPVVIRQHQRQDVQQQQKKRCRKDSTAADGHGRGSWRVAAEVLHLKEPNKARCRAAAVEPGDIQRNAQAAAHQAAKHIVSRLNWLPADDDPSRLSHRRKRRAAKLAAEAASWRRNRVAAAL